jgi:hypothetical protein
MLVLLKHNTSKSLQSYTVKPSHTFRNNSIITLDGVEILVNNM